MKVQTIVGPDPAAARRRAAAARRRARRAARQAVRAAARELGRDAAATLGRPRARRSATSARVLVSVIDPDDLRHDAAGVLRRGGVPLAARPARRVQALREQPVHARRASPGAWIDYEPAESTTSDVRRQLELARPDLDARQLPRDPPVRASTSASSATTSSVEYPTGSGQQHTLRRDRAGPRRPARRDLAARTPTAAGRSSADTEQLQDDPAWKDNLLFNEYFHGDNGAGLGATHQTGWTALVVDLILDPPRLGAMFDRVSPGGLPHCRPLAQTARFAPAVDVPVGPVPLVPPQGGNVCASCCSSPCPARARLVRRRAGVARQGGRQDGGLPQGRLEVPAGHRRRLEAAEERTPRTRPTSSRRRPRARRRSCRRRRPARASPRSP